MSPLSWSKKRAKSRSWPTQYVRMYLHMNGSYVWTERKMFYTLSPLSSSHVASKKIWAVACDPRVAGAGFDAHRMVGRLCMLAASFCTGKSCV